MVRLSTGLPTESRRLNAAHAFRAVRIYLLCLNAPAAALLPGTARLVFLRRIFIVSVNMWVWFVII